MDRKFSTLKFKNGLKDGLPISFGYLTVSIAFGIKAVSLGVPILLALLTSMTNLTSAGQVAGIEIVASLGSFIEIILLELIINSRYMLMGISLSQKFDSTFTTSARFITSAFNTDEIFAMASSKPSKISKNYLLGLAIMPYFSWALGTLIGAVAGDILPTAIVSAMGIALYAIFVKIIIPPAIEKLSILFVISLSAGLSCLMYYVPFFSFISTGIQVIISTLVSSIITALVFPIKVGENNE